MSLFPTDAEGLTESFDDEKIIDPLRSLTDDYKQRCQSYESASNTDSPLQGLISKIQSDRTFQTELAKSIGTIIAFKYALYTGRQSKIAQRLIKEQYKFIDHVCAYGKVAGDIYYKDPNDGNIKRYTLFELENRYAMMIKVLKDTQEKIYQENFYDMDDNMGSGAWENFKNTEEVERALIDLESEASVLENDIQELGLNQKVWIARPWKLMFPDEDEIPRPEEGGSQFNNTLLSLWKRHVDQMQELIEIYREQIIARNKLATSLANVEPKDDRWLDILSYDRQCNRFSFLYKDFEQAPDQKDLRDNFTVFYELLDEYNGVKDIIERLDLIMIEYGIGITVTQMENGAYRTVNKLNYDESELKKNKQIVNATITNLPHIIKNRLLAPASVNPNSLVNRLAEFEQNVKGLSRNNVKNTVVNMINAFANNWSQFVVGYFNWYIVGPAGAGKSTIAQSIGPVLASMGVLVFGDFYTESRSTLVGEVVGATAIKTRGKLIRSLENVMFIDEAYAVAKAGSGDVKYDQFGLECLDEIVGFLDKYQGQICVIVAGYECMMKEYFLKANEGLTRRFSAKYSVILERLCPSELWQIFRADLGAKIRFRDQSATIDTVLSADAQKLIVSVFYAGSGITNKDPTDGTITFRHLFENEASDAVELSQELSTIYFAKNTQLTVGEVSDFLVGWLKSREKKDVLFELDRNSKCEPIGHYDRIAMNLSAIEYNNVILPPHPTRMQPSLPPPILSPSLPPTIPAETTGAGGNKSIAGRMITPSAQLPPPINLVTYNPVDRSYTINIPGQNPTIFDGKTCARDGKNLKRDELVEVCNIVTNADYNKEDKTVTMGKLYIALKDFVKTKV